MFKLKKINLRTKNELIVLITEQDAKELSIKASDKIKVFGNYKGEEKYVICNVEIFENFKNSGIKKEYLKTGEIGLLERAFEKLGLSENSRVSISLASKPKSLEYIRDKFKGKKLTEEQFLEIMTEIVNNNFSKVETTYFVLSTVAHQLTTKETIGLTKAMINVGKVLDFKDKSDEIVVDKHCIGGVPNNRTTMLIVPIVSSVGLKIPKTSSRSITSPAGTADTMEVLANVDVGISKMYEIVKKTNGCIIWGGNLDLSPADDIIIQVEHPLGIDSIGQMIASILSKKKSAGATHVLIDIPIGRTAKVRDYKKAEILKEEFEKVAKAIGLKIKVIITDGSEPIGRGIGPLNEAEDILSILKLEDTGLEDLKEKALKMSGEIFEMAKVVKKGRGYDLAKEILISGKAYRKFMEIIDFQGRKEVLKPAKYKYDFLSKVNGKVREINNKKISKLAFILGAPDDKAAGLRLNKKTGDVVIEGEKLFEMYSNSNQKMKFAKNYLKDNLDIYRIK